MRRKCAPIAVAAAIVFVLFSPPSVKAQQIEAALPIDICWFCLFTGDSFTCAGMTGGPGGEFCVIPGPQLCATVGNCGWYALEDLDVTGSVIPASYNDESYVPQWLVQGAPHPSGLMQETATARVTRRLCDGAIIFRHYEPGVATRLRRESRTIKL